MIILIFQFLLVYDIGVGGGEGGSDLPSVSSVEFLRVSKNTSHICRKLSDLLQTAFFDYFFSENFVKILIDNRGRY